MYIAGRKTADDWRKFRTQLVPGNAAAPWDVAVEDYFIERLRHRYLNPISILQTEGTFQGEGFSIVAIQCTLIEFLASTREGLTYRYLKRGESLGPFEYSQSAKIFTDFLALNSPFDQSFDRDTARDFYSSIRCGLLHEAQTKNGWTIWAGSSGTKVVDVTRRILFRNNLQAAVLQYVEYYGKAILHDAKMQSAFLRKFDALSA